MMVMVMTVVEDAEDVEPFPPPLSLFSPHTFFPSLAAGKKGVAQTERRAHALSPPPWSPESSGLRLGPPQGMSLRLGPRLLPSSRGQVGRVEPRPESLGIAKSLRGSPHARLRGSPHARLRGSPRTRLRGSPHARLRGSPHTLVYEVLLTRARASSRGS